MQDPQPLKDPERECHIRLAKLRNARWIDDNFEERFEPLVSELAAYVKAGKLDWETWSSKLVEGCELTDAEAARAQELYESARPHQKMTRSGSTQKARETKAEIAAAKDARANLIAQKGWAGVVEHIEGQCALQIRGLERVNGDTWRLHAVSGMTGEEHRVTWSATYRACTRGEVHARIQGAFAHGLDGIDGDEWAILWPVLAIKAERATSPTTASICLDDVLSYNPHDGSIEAYEGARGGWWYVHPHPDTTVRAVWVKSVLDVAERKRKRLTGVEVERMLEWRGWQRFEAAATPERCAVAYMIHEDELSI